MPSASSEHGRKAITRDKAYVYRLLAAAYIRIKIGVSDFFFFLNRYMFNFFFFMNMCMHESFPILFGDMCSDVIEIE